MRTGLLNRRILNRESESKREMIKFRNFENENDEFKIKVGIISRALMKTKHRHTHTHIHLLLHLTAALVRMIVSSEIFLQNSARNFVFNLHETR